MAMGAWITFSQPTVHYHIDQSFDENRSPLVMRKFLLSSAVTDPGFPVGGGGGGGADPLGGALTSDVYTFWRKRM